MPSWRDLGFLVRLALLPHHIPHMYCTQGLLCIFYVVSHLCEVRFCDYGENDVLLLFFPPFLFLMFETSNSYCLLHVPTIRSRDPCSGNPISRGGEGGAPGFRRTRILAVCSITQFILINLLIFIFLFPLSLPWGRGSCCYSQKVIDRQGSIGVGNTHVCTLPRGTASQSWPLPLARQALAASRQ